MEILKSILLGISAIWLNPDCPAVLKGQYNFDDLLDAIAEVESKRRACRFSLSNGVNGLLRDCPGR